MEKVIKTIKLHTMAIAQNGLKIENAKRLEASRSIY